MSQRQEFVELAVKNGANLRALCRQFGITPRTGYKWLSRYRAGGLSGLYGRSRRPHQSPQQSSPALEAEVLRVRRAHRAWGGRKIRWTLQQAGLFSPPSASTITAILARHGELDPQESSKHRPLQRFEMASPNELWQMDFKGPIEMANGQLATRWQSWMTVPASWWASTPAGGSRAVPCGPAVRVVRVLWAAGAHADGQWLRLERLPQPLELLAHSLGHPGCACRPRHPQTQGKDERLHRTLQSELLWPHLPGSGGRAATIRCVAGEL